MVVEMEQVLAELNRDEPDYLEAAQLGPEALPHLEMLVKSPDSLLASKATYMASLIHDEKSVAILRIAAHSNFPEVRVAAAAACRNVSINAVNDILNSLKNDQDSGVRRQALKSIQR
jgi:HEAT repeat protein